VARRLPIALSHTIEGRVYSLSIHTANGLGGELPRSAVGPVSREVRGPGVFLISVNTALVVGAAYWSLTSEFGTRALRDIEVNLRTLALTFAETYPDAKIALKEGIVSKAEVPRMRAFGNQSAPETER